MKKILMLNTELGTQMQIYLALCDAYKIEIAENIESVMYYLRKMRPEIFLLDYKLEGIEPNGKSAEDLVRKIKRKYTQLKIMMIMDTEDKERETILQQHGADGVLCKPIKKRHLVSHVKKLATSTASATTM